MVFSFNGLHALCGYNSISYLLLHDFAQSLHVLLVVLLADVEESSGMAFLLGGLEVGDVGDVLHSIACFVVFETALGVLIAPQFVVDHMEAMVILLEIVGGTPLLGVVLEELLAVGVFLVEPAVPLHGRGFVLLPGPVLYAEHR